LLYFGVFLILVGQIDVAVIDGSHIYSIELKHTPLLELKASNPKIPYPRFRVQLELHRK